LHEPKEALQAYQKVLEGAPGRRNATRGAEEASRLAGLWAIPPNLGFRATESH
jgi:hypothetical protein